ncbi:hypothetical protein PR202_gb04552 [Eleusine coracana subsp. coracana]|uniref:BTB/POZ domain-containing protein n=1 Tax=Eleusine coracana subsp. coracana TaxID=191504 RepID=A0AAV5E452_ELECO|nr:hypothetical protein PR202_gb04552 [Eleusine coracana subsp. coracana]
MTELESDVVVEVGEMSFYLHKFPLLSRSGVLQRMISEYQPPEDGNGMCTLQLDDIPGGAKAFELAAKFCYDVKIELNALNVVCLRCAAEYLRMTDEYAEGNLITQAESFLSDVLGNWKDAIKALETCEGVLPTAEDLHLVSRCITALASRACCASSDTPTPSTTKILLRNNESRGDALWNGIGSWADAAAPGTGMMDWWYEDVSFLSLPMFKRLIQAMEAKGMRAESIAGAIMFYAGRFLPGLKRNTSFSNALAASLGAASGGDGMSSRNVTPRAASVSAPSEGDQRYFLEEIVALLPAKKGSHPWLSEAEREQLCRLMNCQKLSLEACTHAAQNERLPLRVVVQVLFFEQLRLRTSIAGWFFVSDNAAADGGARTHHGGAIVPKGGSAAAAAGALAETEIDPDFDAPEGKEESITDVKERVSELEKECRP